MRHLEKIDGKKMWDRIRNKTLKQEPIRNKIIKRQLNSYGRLIRIEPNRIIKRVHATRRTT